MRTETEIDAIRRARITDPHTSHEAAAKVDFAKDHQARILSALAKRNGQTIYELGAGTGLDHVAVARRMGELESDGLVITDGQRLSPRGRKCRVWWIK